MYQCRQSTGCRPPTTHSRFPVRRVRHFVLNISLVLCLKLEPFVETSVYGFVRAAERVKGHDPASDSSVRVTRELRKREDAPFASQYLHIGQKRPPLLCRLGR